MHADATNTQLVQSAIEETIERIKLHKGVERYIILDNGGAVLRSFPQGAEDAEELGGVFKEVAKRATHVVRDLDPSDNLEFMRVRTANKELMVGVHNEYTVIIQQRWTPAEA